MRIVIVGGGGHAGDVLSALEARNDTVGGSPGCEDEIVGLVADGEIDMRRFDGRGVVQVGEIDELSLLRIPNFIAAQGYPRDRKSVADRVEAFGLEAASVVDPSAHVPEGLAVGSGTVILGGARVSWGVKIGRHVMIGTGTIVGHDCRLGDFATVMPGAVVSGDVDLGEGCVIGANATVIEKRKVGAWAIVGAGAVVSQDIPPGVTAVGVPARWTRSARSFRARRPAWSWRLRPGSSHRRRS